MRTVHVLRPNGNTLILSITFIDCRGLRTKIIWGKFLFVVMYLQVLIFLLAFLLNLLDLSIHFN